ncbi:hypothetical protein DAI22_02g002500 [Oryza sativa Japonica Group]|nr:hypothetical protein DAI22_02g002500 [Oryza sativa Japonica Group]
MGSHRTRSLSNRRRRSPHPSPRPHHAFTDRHSCSPESTPPPSRVDIAAPPIALLPAGTASIHPPRLAAGRTTDPFLLRRLLSRSLPPHRPNTPPPGTASIHPPRLAAGRTPASIHPLQIAIARLRLSRSHAHRRRSSPDTPPIGDRTLTLHRRHNSRQMGDVEDLTPTTAARGDTTRR